MPKRVGIIGSGPIGQTLGRGFAKRGYEVRIGSREPSSEKLQNWIKQVGENASTGTLP